MFHSIMVLRIMSLEVKLPKHVSINMPKMNFVKHVNTANIYYKQLSLILKYQETSS